MHIHKGFLKEGYNGEEDVLMLNDEPVAEVLEYISGRFVTIAYYISNVEIDPDEAALLFVQSYYGELNARYEMRYSEVTGYLWTDEDLNVGGHDLLEELRTHIGKYLILKVETHEGAEKA